jgi:preprotein translocase subunit SecE
LARDRKRAKQRQQRRGAAASQTPPRPPARPPADDGGGSGSHLTRADLPGALGHAGDVDEFDAALVRGAGGVPAPLPAASPIPTDEESLAEEIERATAPAPTQRTGRSGNGSSAGNGLAAAPLPVSGRDARLPAEKRQSLPSRAIAFLRASWAELQRVQWPDRPQVTQATAVVLGFVAIAGLYFGLADYVAKEIVEAIL